MRNWRQQQINPTRVLLAIRQNEANNLRDLASLLIPLDIGPSLRNRFRMDLHHIVNELTEAGLVVSSDTLEGKLKVTDQLERIQSALEISLNGLSKFGANTIPVEPLFGQPSVKNSLNNSFPDVFVLMPFSSNLKPIYDDHIRPVVEEMNLSVGRADDFFAARSIISDIWHAIYHARFIIADCTDRNPNVFYEIGVAHTVGKPTILISQSMDDVPFDLRHLRCIVYKYTVPEMIQFNKTLKKTLETEIEVRSNNN